VANGRGESRTRAARAPTLAKTTASDQARINRELEEIAEHEAGPASTEAAYLAAMWRIDWERERALD